MNRFNRERATCWSIVAWLACSMMLPGPALAAWVIQPRVDTLLSFETNPRNVREDRKDLPDGTPNPAYDNATSLVAFVELRTSWQTQRQTATFNPKYLRSFYADSDNSDLEDQDLYLPVSYSFRTLQSETGFRARYTDLSVRTSEFASVDPDAPASDGSGDIRNVDDSQVRWSVSPFWTYRFSERNAINLNANYDDVSYDKFLSTRTDYTAGSVSTGWTHTLDPRNSFGLIIGAGYYDSDGLFTSFSPNLPAYSPIDPGRTFFNFNNQTDYYSLRAQYTRLLSERTSITVTGGISNTNFSIKRDPNAINTATGEPVCLELVEIAPGFAIPQEISCTNDGDANNFVGGIDLTRRAETSRLTLSLDQQIRPNSNGVTTLSTIGRIYWTKDLSERFDFKIGTVLVRNEDVGGDSQRERTYANAEASFRYGFTREISVRGGYKLRADDATDFSGNDQGDAYNHMFFLGLSWTGKGWR